MKSIGTLIVVVVFIAAVPEPASGAWNLPYPQPARYDLRSGFASDMLTYLSVYPNYLDSNMRKGWTFYKANYLMSNGLVNQMQGQGVGTNVAVSEGQGYGMLLAVLNNDQATYNRIFGAANTNMWDQGHQSYFYWSWPDRQQGAATDADLDICLSLVFADQLAKKGYWQAYNSGGVTYNSRAKEMVQSIRQHMTANDYLLPGDNWGGDGSNNLNPSYFAVAWLKVFNAFAQENGLSVDFTPVIAKCYQVLALGPRYSKGQAPDWITPSGTRASKGGLGMTNDAIRTPWRIAMDALWFGDARAIAYCAKSKGTLTEWANAQKNLMVAQMSQYDESGTSIASTRGSFSEVAMWSCAVAGSKDTAYTHLALNSVVFDKIAGKYQCFGDWTMSDQYYYYKQSLGMLGFAAISGQFPNIWDDLHQTIQPVVVHLTASLAANKTTVDLTAGGVAFSAAVDTPAAWTLTVKGRTSGTTESFTGTGKSISANWTGAGWHALEYVDATLNVAGLDPSTQSSRLTVAVQITKTQPKPAVDPGSWMVIHDMENQKTVNNWGGAWFVYTDQKDGGTSTTNPDSAATAAKLVAAAAGNSGTWGAKVAVTVTANAAKGFQYAGAGMDFFKNGANADLSMFEAVSFDYKTENVSQPIVFSLATTNIADFAYGMTNLTASASWTTRVVNFVELQVPSWGTGTLPDYSRSTKVQWQFNQAGAGTLYIDNVKAKLKAGMLPGDDILSRLGSSVAGRSAGPASRGIRAVLPVSGGILVCQYGGGLLPAGVLCAELYDLAGARVMRRSLATAGRSSAFVPLAGPSAGRYLVIARFENADGGTPWYAGSFTVR